MKIPHPKQRQKKIRQRYRGQPALEKNACCETISTEKKKKKKEKKKNKNTKKKTRKKN